MALNQRRTYGRIEASAKGWMITEIEPHVAIRLKAIFPRIPKGGKPPYVIGYSDQAAADIDWFTSRYPLAASESDRATIRERRTLFEVQQSEVERILAADWKPTSAARFREGMAAFDYQLRAAEMARRTGRLLLMDELGLGKTVSALAAISDPAWLPALVVPQTHLTLQWQEKVEEFTELRSHIFRSTTPYLLPPADVYICPYSKLAGWINHAKTAGFKSVIFDEVQELRGGTTTAKGGAAIEFAHRARMVMGLSGTPIYNYGEEIWRVMRFLDASVLSDYSSFLIEWCGGQREVKDPNALGTYLRESNVSLRRTRADVGHERQFANVVAMEVPYDEQRLSVDSDAMADLANRVLTGSFTMSGQASREFDMRLRHATGMAKARSVAAFVRMLLEAGKPVLLAGWHRDVYDIWLEELRQYRPVMYTGTESPAQKNRAKEAFVRGDTPLMIISLRSGAGLDGLQQRCSTVVFGELDWSPKVHEQVVGRLDRPGQSHPVDAIYLYSDGGSDPAVLGVLGVKSSQSAGIVDPGKELVASPSDASRIKALAADYLSRSRAVPPVPPAATAVPANAVPDQACLEFV